MVRSVRRTLHFQTGALSTTAGAPRTPPSCPESRWMRFSTRYASECGGSVPRAGSWGYSEWAARNRVPMGFMLGIAFVIFAQPTLPWLVTGAALALIGLAIRAWAAGCLDKNS